MIYLLLERYLLVTVSDLVNLIFKYLQYRCGTVQESHPLPVI